MPSTQPQRLTPSQKLDLLTLLKARFDKHMTRHAQVAWDEVQVKLEKNEQLLWSVQEMERTGGEPDVVSLTSDKDTHYYFVDCAPQSPAGRRSVCYDAQALHSRKEHKPKNSAVEMAAAMGIELLSEDHYRQLQHWGEFDTKTSSWIKTPDAVRTLGGALYADRRYDRIFVYHNGAESYYAARGFRGALKI